MQSLIKIRPHHLLCLNFFIGYGYSDKFTKHMANLKAQLEESNPETEILSGEDMFCEECPHNKGKCESYEKVNALDENVIKESGIKPGDTMRYFEFEEIIRNKIIKAGKLESVCANTCEWASICKKSVRQVITDNG